MNQNERDIQRKLRILKHAKKIGPGAPRFRVPMT